MRFAFTEDHEQLHDAVAEALAGECPPARVREAWARRDDALRATLADLGVLALNLPVETGGLGLGAVSWVRVAEACGRVAAPVVLAETLATNPAIASLNPGLAERVASGDALVTALPAGGLCPDADVAEAIWVVDGDTVSLIHKPTLTREAGVDGSRRLFRVDGELEALPVDGARVADTAALATAAELLGLGRAMIDLAVAYAKEREQFGRPIGSFQAVQHHLVDALLALRFAAPAVYRAAWSLEHDAHGRSVHVSMAKLYASEAASLAARKALQVHGAIGYAFEHDLHLWMKRAWSLSRAWGDPGWHLRRVSAHVLGDA